VRLFEYLRSNGIKRSDFIKHLGVHELTLHNYIHGVFPSKKVADKIVEATNGEVQYSDIFFPMTEEEYKRSFEKGAKKREN